MLIPKWKCRAAIVIKAAGDVLFSLFCTAAATVAGGLIGLVGWKFYHEPWTEKMQAFAAAVVVMVIVFVVAGLLALYEWAYSTRMRCRMQHEREQYLREAGDLAQLVGEGFITEDEYQAMLQKGGGG